MDWDSPDFYDMPIRLEGGRLNDGCPFVLEWTGIFDEHGKELDASSPAYGLFILPKLENEDLTFTLKKYLPE